MSYNPTCSIVSKFHQHPCPALEGRAFQYCGLASWRLQRRSFGKETQVGWFNNLPFLETTMFLMEKSQCQPPGSLWNLVNNNGTFTISAGARFLASTVWVLLALVLVLRLCRSCVWNAKVSFFLEQRQLPRSLYSERASPTDLQQNASLRYHLSIINSPSDAVIALSEGIISSPSWPSWWKHQRANRDQTTIFPKGTKRHKSWLKKHLCKKLRWRHCFLLLVLWRI